MAKVTIPQKIPADLGVDKVNSKPVNPDDSLQHTAAQITRQNDLLIEQATEHNVNDNRVDANAVAAAAAQSIGNTANAGANAAQGGVNTNSLAIADLLARVQDLEVPGTGGDPTTSITWSSVVFTETFPASDGTIATLITGTLAGGTYVAGTLIEGTHYTLTGTVPVGLVLNVVAASADVVLVTLTGVATAHEATNSVTDAFNILMLDAAVAGTGLAPNDGTEMRDFSVTFFDDPVPGATFFDALAITTAQANAENANSGLGMNTDFISDSSTSFAFKDLMKQSRTPISGTIGGAWDNGQPIIEDSDGWPTQLAAGQVIRYLFMWDVPALLYPGGTYRVEWQGAGTVTVVGADSIGATGANFVEFDKANTISQAQVRVELEATTPGNYVKNIVVLAPDPDTGLVTYSAAGAENYVTQPFYPRWLEKMAPYKVIRFMDFGETNFSGRATWSERSRKTHRSYTDNGGPYETMIESCNQLNAHAWICMPVKSDDDFVTKLAESVKADLDVTLNVWPELSNEVWNGQFNPLDDGSQRSTYLQTFGGSTLQGYAERHRQVMQIWTDVFSDQPTRLVRVMGMQAANNGVAGTQLGVAGAAAMTDVLAGAPYAGNIVTPSELSSFPQIATWTGAQWLAEIRSATPLLSENIEEVIGWMMGNEQHAIAHNLKLVCYEMGYDLIGGLGGENNASLNVGLDECYRLSEWYDEMLEFMNLYNDRRYNGADRYSTTCWYYLATRLNKFSRFGLMEGVMQTDPDRWRAHKDFRDASPNEPPLP